MKRFALAVTISVYLCNTFFYSQAQADEYDDLPAISYTMGAFIVLESMQKSAPIDETLKPKLEKITAEYEAKKISTQVAWKQVTEAQIDYYRKVFGMAGYNFDKSWANFAKLCNTYNSCGNFSKKSQQLDTSGGGIRIAYLLTRISIQLTAKPFRVHLPSSLRDSVASLPSVLEDKSYYRFPD